MTSVGAKALRREGRAQMSQIPPRFLKVSQWVVSRSRSGRGKDVLGEHKESGELREGGEVQGPCSAALTVGFALFCNASQCLTEALIVEASTSKMAISNQFIARYTTR